VTRDISDGVRCDTEVSVDVVSVRSWIRSRVDLRYSLTKLFSEVSFHTVCLFWFVSVEMSAQCSQPKINVFFNRIHSRLHPVNFRVQLRKMNKVVIFGENIVRSGNSQDQRVLAGLVKNSGNL